MEKLHPRAVWLFFITSVSGWIFLFLFISIFYFLIGLSGGFPLSFFTFFLKNWFFFLSFIVVFAYVVARLQYHFYRYELTNAVFKKESGIIWKRYVSIPYNRIQNVDIHRNLWARVLGLSDIQIHTAGVGGVASGEGSLPALSREKAEKLRETLIKKIGHEGRGL